MIDLTIIVPHYNTPHCLEVLLKSIPRLNNVQVLVIDDKSDKHLAELDAIKADSRFSHVSFIDNTTNVKSAGTCRNIGQEHAIGKWVMYADADDYFVDGFYEMVEKFFCTDYEVVFFVPTSVDVDTGKKALKHKSFADAMLKYASEPSLQNELELRYYVLVPWSKMVRLDFIRKRSINFDEVIVSNDVAHSVKLGHYMQKFCVSLDVIYIVTQRENSLSRTYDEVHYDVRVKTFLWWHSFLKQNLCNKKFKMVNYNICFILFVEAFDAIGYKLGIKKTIQTLQLIGRSGVKIPSVKFLPKVIYWILVRRKMLERAA